VDKIKKEINTIYTLLGGLLGYLDVAEKVVGKLISALPKNLTTRC
jgi:hypothetical protein